MPNELKDKYNLPTDYNSQLVGEYLGYANKAIGQQRQAALGNVANNQSMLYETLGRNQLQNERDIAQRRIQAQRSGMSSAQLAAFEMQNIMTSQLGAQQVAQQSLLEMGALEAQFAGMEAQNQANMFELLNTNRASIASIDAQKFSSSGIKQAQELFPDETAENQLIIAKQLSGMELTPAEEKIYKALLKKRTTPPPTIVTNNKSKTKDELYAETMAAQNERYLNGQLGRDKDKT